MDAAKVLPDRISVERGEERVFVDWLDDLAALEPMDAALPDGAKAPCLSILYRHLSMPLVKQVVAHLAEPSTIVDDGFGTVLSGPDFASKLARDPGWDWMTNGRG